LSGVSGQLSVIGLNFRPRGEFSRRESAQASGGSSFAADPIHFPADWALAAYDVEHDRSITRVPHH
jgi:hypothetical protein